MSLIKLFNLQSVGLLSKKVLNLSVHTRKFNDVPFEDIPEVSSTLIKRVLNKTKISFNEGFTCFIIACPFCTKRAKSNIHKLYINKTTGMFMCSSCKFTGQWNFLDHHFNSKKEKSKKVQEICNVMDHQEKLAESLKQVRESSDLLVNSDKFEKILNKFKLPKISSESIKNLDVRIDKPLQNLFFPLENVECETVGYRKINYQNGDDLIIPHIMYGGLIVGKALKNREAAILVPNISDFLILLDSKITLNVVCLPNGVNSLSQYVLPTLERFQKLILWFGNDLKSWDSARHFAKKLGERRCFFVRPNEKQLLPHLVEGQDFKSIVNSAQPIWHKSITNFANLRKDVFSDLQNIDKIEGVKWKRFPALNKILRGHRRGELTVITGPTGCGKTTFISEYSLDLAMQGVNTLWGSFEIRNVRLARTMLQQFAGFPLDENLSQFDSLADKFELLPIYFMTFHGQQTIKVVMDAVEHATYVHDIAHVIIDNVQFMMGITEDSRHMDRFWTQDVIIAAFRSFATRKNCHVTLVIHPRKERDEENLTTNSIFGGAKASQEADNVFIIQDKRLTSTRGKKYLQICKNRYSGDLGVMPLDFDKAGLSYASKKKVKSTDNIEETTN
ncbi:mitochondrial DNA helicase [Tribolium castaneum]|uniref:DNA 5'-3' helicase n=1 Tax=Tribolium castaneum TaxID=7070 RepID=D6WGI5_TRICA|nr:PREDICTED: twinkle protein, mitochondrial [Tribolium castaneum]EFA00172.2 Twinkle protein, mitochondrial-like Protein [Tribolium castaneum]|eukprot:XP_970366.3 PREDICTED: twinkle protein, mitochondrial [Tribolium castaneum]